MGLFHIFLTMGNAAAGQSRLESKTVRTKRVTTVSWLIPFGLSDWNGLAVTHRMNHFALVTAVESQGQFFAMPLTILQLLKAVRNIS